MAEDGDEAKIPDNPDSPAGDARTEADHRPEDEVSWLGCLWLVIVPLIVLGAAVVTLNWLGC
jgi:hypothetical protein